MDLARKSWYVAVCLLLGCGRTDPDATQSTRLNVPKPPPEAAAPAPDPQRGSSPIAAAAQNQIGTTVSYDPSYVGLSYPGGDVPLETGVCTDVVVRALRDALALDLQKRVHEDMKASFSQYPKIWGLRKPDRNIDHRRVPNLRRYFERQGYALTPTQNPDDYRAGDLVTCTVNGNLAHIMIVSDNRTPDGVPLVIHNIGRGTREEKRLFSFPLTGHYRITVGAGAEAAPRDSE